MPRQPQPGQYVRWRDAWHAHAIGWLYLYGPGPFRVLGVVGDTPQELPAVLLLQTDLGPQQVCEVWLELDPEGDRCGICPGASGLTVLVVDDDPDATDSLALLVSLWGHQPLVAYDAVTAWAMALAERPDVVLLDLGLPDLDGWQLARRLRAEPSLEGIVLLAMSGYGTDADRHRSAAAGIDCHLVKPADPELICHLLDSYAARHRQQLASS
jgi:CheY-like chemotaxis protein